ncbi:MAG: phage integrase SAM-like domain-containing protein [Fuerstiella sp.]
MDHQASQNQVRVQLSLPSHLKTTSVDFTFSIEHQPAKDNHETFEEPLEVKPEPVIVPAITSTPTVVEFEQPKPSQPTSFEDYYNQHLRDHRAKSISAKTCNDHASSAQKFDSFLSETHPENSMIDVIENNKTMLEDFASWLFANRKNSGPTVTRRLTHVLMIANAMIKYGDLQKIGSELLSSKLIKTLHRQIVGEGDATDRRIPSLNEVQSIAGAVDKTLKHPYGTDAPYFWEGWIQFSAMYGPRSRDIVSVDPERPEKRGLRKQDVYLNTLCPMADVNNALNEELHSSFGWLWYNVGKDHSSDTPRILIPMSKQICDWVKYFMSKSPANDDRVFPGTRDDPDSFLSQRPISLRWKSLLEKAGVDKRIRLSEGKGNVIAIRKAAANWWLLQTAKHKQDERLAEKLSHYLLHHAEVIVSAKHYLSVQAAVLPVMIELLPTFPVLRTSVP